VKGETGCIVEVTDNGRSIPAEDLPNIFRPFYTTKGEGTGLGLSLVDYAPRNENFVLVGLVKQRS
jgi:signal transduction histidine kinase